MVRSLDGIEAIVPNEMLVTTTVLNHSHTTREIRVRMPVQVALRQLTSSARSALMEEAARAEPRVRRNRPTADGLSREFGDSGIDLELGIWLARPAERSARHCAAPSIAAILPRIRRNGIAIPLPAARRPRHRRHAGAAVRRLGTPRLLTPVIGRRAPPSRVEWASRIARPRLFADIGT